MVRRQEHDERLREQRIAVESRVRRDRRGVPLVGQADVELTRLEGEYRGVRRDVPCDDLELGVVATQVDERGQRDASGCGPEHRHADRAGDRAGDGPHVGESDLAVGKDRVGVAHEFESRRRQSHRMGRPLEERDAHLALECGDLLGDGRLRHVEGLRRGGDRAAGGDLAQDLQASGVDHRNSTVRP